MSRDELEVGGRDVEASLFQNIPFGFEEAVGFDFVHFHGHIERTLTRVVRNISEGRGVVIRGPKGRNKTTALKYFALLFGRFVAHYALHRNSCTDNLWLALSVTRRPLNFVCFKVAIKKVPAPAFFRSTFLSIFQ